METCTYNGPSAPVPALSEVAEATGEWTYEEGCLSIPGFHFEIVRPKVVTVKVE